MLREFSHHYVKSFLSLRSLTGIIVIQDFVFVVTGAEALSTGPIRECGRPIEFAWITPLGSY